MGEDIKHSLDVARDRLQSVRDALVTEVRGLESELAAYERDYAVKVKQLTVRLENAKAEAARVEASLETLKLPASDFSGQELKRKKRSPSYTPVERECKHCKESFTSDHPRKDYCSQDCKREAHTLHERERKEALGKRTVRPISGGLR